MYPNTVLTPEQRADLHAQARRQAQVLRRDAVAAFWHSVYTHVAQALRATRAHTSPSRNPSGV